MFDQIRTLRTTDLSGELPYYAVSAFAPEPIQYDGYWEDVQVVEQPHQPASAFSFAHSLIQATLHAFHLLGSAPHVSSVA